MVVIHLFLVLERLRVAGASPEAEAAAQALVDAFVSRYRRLATRARYG